MQVSRGGVPHSRLLQWLVGELEGVPEEDGEEGEVEVGGVGEGGEVEVGGVGEGGEVEVEVGGVGEGGEVEVGVGEGG